MLHEQKQDDWSLNLISDVLTGEKETIAVAESVTSGVLQTVFSMAKNAMQFFQGGITVYNLEQKVRHLHVDPVIAKQVNCVSEEVAAQMAKNVADLFKSNWGIGITGYASPVPEKNIRELFACYSIYYEQKEMIRNTVFVANNSPQEAKIAYTNIVLNSFSTILAHHSTHRHLINKSRFIAV